MANLPLLPATVIGSWSFPGWYAKFLRRRGSAPRTIRRGRPRRSRARRERLRQTLKHIDPERVQVTPDCGFSQTARFVAVRTLTSMAEGVRLVRRELKPTTCPLPV
jgi:hypothetical protein